MDVEIVKKNGRKFRLSDYGVVKDFVVDSIDQEVVRDSVEGRPGSLDYGVYVGDRSISVPFILKARDLHDYAHLRDELYSILGDREPFYIREMRRPKTLQYDFVSFGQSPKWSAQTDNEYVNGKQYLVRLDRSMSPSQKGIRGEVTLEFVTSGLPYSETTYTTLELHDSGYATTAEKYGLVDDIDDDKVKYRFEPEMFREELTKSEWELGAISSGTGENTISDTLIRTKGYFKTTPGQEYVFEELLNNSKILYWWIHEYDNDGNYVGYFATQGNTSPSKGTFTARGSRVRMRPTLRSGQTISVDDVGVNIRPTISGATTTSQFTVYNAGNVPVESENMFLNIEIKDVLIGENMTVLNKTTGESHEYNFGTFSPSLYKISGMNVTRDGVNVFRNTNRRFVSLAVGDNDFEISGATFSEVSFNFKYLYK